LLIITDLDTILFLSGGDHFSILNGDLIEGNNHENQCSARELTKKSCKIIAFSKS